MSVKNLENDSLSPESGAADDSVKDPGNERRSFLRQSVNWISLAFAAAVLYPLMRFLQHDVPKKPQHVKVHKQLATGSFYVAQDFVLFDDGEKVWAVSRKCTHLGCKLHFSELENLFVCPCHQSRFTKQGTRVSGPAKKNLPSYRVAKEVENNNPVYIVTL